METDCLSFAVPVGETTWIWDWVAMSRSSPMPRKRLLAWALWEKLVSDWE